MEINAKHCKQSLEVPWEEIRDELDKRLNGFTFNVAWSEEDEAYIGRVDRFSLLAAHGDTPEQALMEILEVTLDALEDLDKEPLNVHPL